MGFDKIEAVSLTDQFVQKIESMIISGELTARGPAAAGAGAERAHGREPAGDLAGLIELEKMGFVEIVTRQACTSAITARPARSIRSRRC